MKTREKKLLKELANLHKTKDVTKLMLLGHKHFGFSENVTSHYKRDLEFCDIHALIDAYYLCNTERYFKILIELQNKFNNENK